MKTKDSNPLKILEDYLIMKKYANNTINNYISAVKKVRDYSGSDVYHLTIKDFESYILYAIKELKLSRSYVNQIISGGKHFLKTGLNKKDYTLNKLERPRKRKSIPIILSIEEVNEMIKTARNIKHKAIIVTLYDLLIRRQELINLRWEDIDRKQMVVRINNSKGAKDRIVPLTNRVIKILEKHWYNTRSLGYVFKGSSLDGKYSPSSIRNVLNYCSEYINKNVTPHIIRHTSASHLVDRGINLKKLQDILGHSSSKTTEIYIHTTVEGFKDIKRPELVI